MQLGTVKLGNSFARKAKTAAPSVSAKKVAF